MRELILKMLNLRISVPSFLLVASSIALAVYILVNVDIIALTPFGKHLYFGPLYWSILLVIGDALCLFGMVFRPNFPVVRIGAAISFAMWLFGNIALYAIASANILFAWFIPLNLIYIYLWLAASVGSFRKK